MNKILVLGLLLAGTLNAADVPISGLPAATTVSGSDVVPIVQSATTKKASFTVQKSLWDSYYQPLDADLTALAALTGTHTIYYRSAANTWSAVTIGSGLDFTGATLSATGAGFAPSNAHYVTTQSETGLSAETSLGALSSGILKQTVSGGVSTPAIASSADITGLFTGCSGSQYLGADGACHTSGTGDFSSNTSTSVDSEIVLFSGTGGKTGKRATGTGIATLTSGVLSATSTTGSGNVVLAGTPTITTPNFTTGFTIGSAAASGNIPIGNGTNYVASTPTYPNSATSGKVLIGDGTNVVLSTPTFPNASATSGKIIKSDGTNWVASTETYAAPGTSGNVLTSDGTNWTSAAAAGGGGTTSKVSGSNFTESAGVMTDITGLSFAAGGSKVYEVDVLLKVQHTSTNGIKFALTHSQGAMTGEVLVFASGNLNTSGNGWESTVVGTATNTARCTSANFDYTVVMKAIVTTAGSPTGNITVQMQRLGAAQTATCYIGSRMTVTQLSP